MFRILKHVKYKTFSLEKNNHRTFGWVKTENTQRALSDYLNKTFIKHKTSKNWYSVFYRRK